MTHFPSVFDDSDQWSTWSIVLSLIVESSQLLIVFVLCMIDETYERKFIRFFVDERIWQTRFFWIYTIVLESRLSLYELTQKNIYRIWSRDFISESIGSIPLNHPRTNIVSIPIDRKETNITLNKKSMIPFVSWIALLKFRHNFIEKKTSSTTVSDNRCFQDSDEDIF